MRLQLLWCIKDQLLRIIFHLAFVCSNSILCRSVRVHWCIYLKLLRSLNETFTFSFVPIFLRSCEDSSVPLQPIATLYYVGRYLKKLNENNINHGLARVRSFKIAQLVYWQVDQSASHANLCTSCFLCDGHKVKSG